MHRPCRTLATYTVTASAWKSASTKLRVGGNELQTSTNPTGCTTSAFSWYKDRLERSKITRQVLDYSIVPRRKAVPADGIPLLLRLNRSQIAKSKHFR